MQHSGWRGPFWPSLLGLSAEISFCFFAERFAEAMAEADAEMFVDVPERPREDVEVILPTSERTENASLSWADRVENGESHIDHGAQAVYPSHLVSEVNAFDGILPQNRLGELSDSERLRLFRLNGVPSRPCSARFTLHDNSVDSREILNRIVATGVPRSHIKCLQRFRSGQVDVTFTRCLLYTSPSPRDLSTSRMPSSA